MQRRLVKWFVVIASWGTASTSHAQTAPVPSTLLPGAVPKPVKNKTPRPTSLPGATTPGLDAPDAPPSVTRAPGHDANAPSPQQELQSPRWRALDKACSACSKDPLACEQLRRDACRQVAAQQAKTLKKAESDCANPASSCHTSFWLQRGVREADITRGSAPDVQDLAGLDRKADVSGSALLVNAVAGLQGFLEERAKAEALKYSVDQLRDRLCTKQAGQYLEQTCKLLDKDELELDEATLVRLKQALLLDLAQLPAALYAALPPAKSADEDVMRAFSWAGAEAVLTVVQQRLPVRELPATWARLDASKYQALPVPHRMTCELHAGSMPGPCWALLLPEVGAAAANLENSGWNANDLAAALDHAAQSFCAVYGPQHDATGACLLSDPEQIEKLLPELQQLARASVRFLQIGETSSILAKAGTPAHEIAARTLPDLADAMDAWSASLKIVFRQADAANLQRAVLGLRLSAALAAQDYTVAVAVLAEAFEAGQPLYEVRLPPKVMKGLGFAARLASAKKPEDAKKAFEEAAEPLGSYRIKYDRAQVTIAVNSFVGTFVGWGPRRESGEWSKFRFATRPLSAPTGVDFTLASFTHHHFGVLLAVVDPFGVGTIDADAKATELDWGALLTPGVLFRWGIGGSPFTALLGAVAQPLARSQDSCGTGGASGKCWKGSYQAGVALSVDIPLMVLR